MENQIAEDVVARDRIDAIIRRLDRMEDNLNHRFEGFPQEYGTAPEVEALRNAIETIRSDHVQRREIDEVKATASTASEELRRRLDVNAGRRNAYTALAAVVVTLLGLAIGFSQKNQLTHTDVSNQIQAEAPWLTDKAEVDRHIQDLEVQVQRLQDQIGQIQVLDRFFCKTRAKLLPQC